MRSGDTIGVGTPGSTSTVLAEVQRMMCAYGYRQSHARSSSTGRGIGIGSDAAHGRGRGRGDVYVASGNGGDRHSLGGKGTDSVSPYDSSNNRLRIRTGSDSTHYTYSSSTDVVSHRNSGVSSQPSYTQHSALVPPSLTSVYSQDTCDLAVHFHDTYGQALGRDI